MDGFEITLILDDEDEAQPSDHQDRAVMPSSDTMNGGLAETAGQKRLPPDHQGQIEDLEKKKTKKQARVQQERKKQVRTQQSLDVQRRRMLREQQKQHQKHQKQQATMDEKRRYDQQLADAKLRGLPWPDPPYDLERDELEWSPSDDEALLDLKSKNRSFYVIGMNLRRSEYNVVLRYRELFDHNSTSTK